MKKLNVMIVILVILSSTIYAGNGIVKVKSNNDFNTTADKLEKLLAEKGMTIFNRIKHSEGAKKVGLKLRPTELIIFGNPMVGTKLMQCNQSVAIDLPQKVLIWEDEKGDVWLSYNNPEYLSERHNLQDCAKVIEKIKGALNNFVTAAAKKE